MNKSLQVLVTAVTCQTATKIMINRDKGSVTNWDLLLSTGIKAGI
jgi:hypothetical protein